MEPEPKDPLVDSILLPNKEVHGTEDRERQGAGVLLGQEAFAKEFGIPRPIQPEKEVAAAPTINAAEQATSPRIETYQSDIQNIVQGGGMSVVEIATAEANRRAKSGGSNEQDDGASAPRIAWKKISMITLGTLLVLGSIALVYRVSTNYYGLSAQPSIPAPFITVDETRVIPLAADATPAEIISLLENARINTSLSLGLMGRLLVTIATTSVDTKQQEMPSQTFVSLLAPQIPENLLRTLQPQFLIGVHSYAQNQPFFVFRVDSYEQAFSGMLRWEEEMQQDLSPLFVNKPLIRIQTQTATSSSSQSAQLLQTPFVDAVVENHDTRVIKNDVGDILLLWTFLDRKILVITTNDATLREVITRLKQAPIVQTPQ